MTDLEKRLRKPEGWALECSCPPSPKAVGEDGIVRPQHQEGCPYRDRLLAADTIESLRQRAEAAEARVAGLLEVLKPFADFYEKFASKEPGREGKPPHGLSDSIYTYHGSAGTAEITLRMCRAAWIRSQSNG